MTEETCLGCGRAYEKKAEELTRCTDCIREVLRVLGDLKTGAAAALLQGAQGVPGEWRMAVTLTDVVSTMNELLALDGRAVSELVRYRVRVNAGIVNHQSAKTKPESDGEFYMGVLGFLNAVFGVRDGGVGAVGMAQEAGGAGHVTEFVSTEDVKDAEEAEETS